MKKANKKLLGSLIAVCLVSFVFASAFTFARYAKNIAIAELNLVVVPPVSNMIDQNEATEKTSDNTVIVSPTETAPNETQKAESTEETTASEPENAPAVQDEVSDEIDDVASSKF